MRFFCYLGALIVAGGFFDKDNVSLGLIWLLFAGIGFLAAMYFITPIYLK